MTLELMTNGFAAFSPWFAAPIDPGDLVAMIVIPIVCLMICWLVWMLTRTGYIEAQARIAFQKQLLQRINSAQEFVQLLQTEAGRQLLENLMAERTAPLQEIVSTLRRGVLLAVVGLGGLSIRLFFPSGFGVFIIAGIFVEALGVGFIVSAGIGYWLSKSWNLFSRETLDQAPPNRTLFG